MYFLPTKENFSECLFDPLTNRTRVNAAVVGVNDTFAAHHLQLFMAHSNFTFLFYFFFF